MARHVGNNGAVYSGATEVGCITAWDWTQTQSSIDTTCMKDTETSNIAGRSSTTGNISMNLNDGDTGQATVVVGASLTLKLYMDGETTGDLYDEVTATIDSVSKSVANDSVVTLQCAWTASAPMTRDNAVA